MEDTKRKRTVLKSGFTRTEKSLHKLLDDKDSLEETINRKFREMSDRWRELQEVHDTYMTMVKYDEYEKEDEWIDDLVSRFEALESLTDRTLRIRTKVEKPTTPVGVESLENVNEKVQPIEQRHVQLERLKLDKFDGNIRKYPGFKERFKLYIEPMCPKSQAPFVLRSHLEQEVKEELENIEDNMSLLWQRLDSKYGNVRKYIDIILQDLSKTTKGDGKAALNMINAVEKAYRDLVRIGAGNEMRNAYIIAMIEKRLPEEMRMEWVKFIAEKDDVDSSATFKLMMDFLSRWRKVIEYDDSAIRAPEKKAGTTNHAAVTKSNSAKSEVCWVHEDGNHPIWNCAVFRKMPMQEKLDMVKLKQACHACLETCCQGAKNPENCEKRFKCRITGCEKPHNILIHQ